MNELIDSTRQEKMKNLREKIQEIGSFQDESKRLIKLVKKSNYQDSDMLDVHSLILLAKEQVKRLREEEEKEKEKEASGEILSEIFKLQDETKRLMKLIKRRQSQDPDSRDINSLIKLARERIEHLTSDD
jgi:hypothetical protein